MTTQNEIIAKLKAEYPTLKVGDDEQGYTDLSPDDYEATIKTWANNQLADEVMAAEAEQAVTDKTALLTRLGLTADEFKTLLGGN